MQQIHKRLFFVYLFFLFFFLDLKAEDPSSSGNYRERFGNVSPSERDVPIEEGEGKGDGWGGGPKRGKVGKGKKKRDDFRRVTGTGSNDPIVPVTGVQTGNLTAVTYKNPSPPAPVLDMAWDSTAWAPTYQAGSRSWLGEKGGLASAIQTDLVKHTGWKVDGDSISVSPDFNGGPYDVHTGQAVTFTREGPARLMSDWGKSAIYGDIVVKGVAEPLRVISNELTLLGFAGLEKLGYRPSSVANNVRITWDWEVEAYQREGGALDAVGSVALLALPFARPVSRVVKPVWGQAPGAARIWGYVGGTVGSLARNTWREVGRAWEGLNGFLRGLGIGTGTAYAGVPFDDIYRIVTRTAQKYFSSDPRLRQIADQFDLDDVIQEVALKLFKIRHTIIHDSGLPSFVHKTLVNFLTDRARQVRASDLARELFEQEALRRSAADLAEGVFRNLGKRAHSNALRIFQEVYDALDDVTRQLVDLRQKGLDFKEIGSQLGLTPEAARQRWKRVLDQVRGQIDMK